MDIFGLTQKKKFYLGLQLMTGLFQYGPFGKKVNNKGRTAGWKIQYKINSVEDEITRRKKERYGDSVK